MLKIMLSRQAEEHLRNPPPGSAAWRAREFGIDLTLLIERLKLTPDERLRQLQRAIIEFENMCGLARGAKSNDSSRADVISFDTASS
jgi:hypothetical protein